MTLCYTMWQVTEKNNRKSGRVLHLKHWFSSLTVLNDTTARWCESSMVTPVVTDRTWAKLKLLLIIWLSPAQHCAPPPHSLQHKAWFQMMSPAQLGGVSLHFDTVITSGDGHQFFYMSTIMPFTITLSIWTFSWGYKSQYSTRPFKLLQTYIKI